MHQTEIRNDVLTRILKRRGRRHIHSQVDAARTALVIIDMQNAFVDSANPSAVPVAQQIVPTINRLGVELRNHGGTVAWVYSTFDDTTKTNWNAFFGGVYSDEFSEAVIDQLRINSPGHALWHELDVHPQDTQFSKDRFSAFLPGHCDLPAYLQEQAIDTVLIAGTVTNVCCESSARDALMQNFNVIMISDANAALSDADHNASMTAIAQTFGDVMSCDDLLQRLQAAPVTTPETASPDVASHKQAAS